MESFWPAERRSAINNNDDSDKSLTWTPTEKTNPSFMQVIRVGNVKDWQGHGVHSGGDWASLARKKALLLTMPEYQDGGYTNTPNFTKGGPPEINFRRT